MECELRFQYFDNVRTKICEHNLDKVLNFANHIMATKLIRFAMKTENIKVLKMAKIIGFLATIQEMAILNIKTISMETINWVRKNTFEDFSSNNVRTILDHCYENDVPKLAHLGKFHNSYEFDYGPPLLVAAIRRFL